MLHCEIRRRDLKLTQKSIGNAMGIQQNLVSFMELGRYIPSREELSKLAETLGISEDLCLEPYIVPGTDARFPPKMKLVQRSEPLAEGPPASKTFYDYLGIKEDYDQR